MLDYAYYGYRLRSGMDLPGLRLLDGAGTPDIVFSRGPVPEALPNASWSNPLLQVAGDAVLVRAAGGRLRFLISGAEQVRLDAPAEAAPEEIETFLCSVVAGVLLHRRGGLILHAACVARNGRALALIGPSGRGKSTLAAALAQAGCGLVTDDICRVVFKDDGAWAIPGPARFRLWPDAAAGLGQDSEALQRGRPEHPKRLLPWPGEVAPVRLAALVRLAIDQRSDEPTLTRLAGPEAVMPIADLVYRTALGRHLGNRIALFENVLRLAGVARVFRLTRNEGPANFPAMTAQSLQALEGR